MRVRRGKTESQMTGEMQGNLPAQLLPLAKPNPVRNDLETQPDHVIFPTWPLPPRNIPH
jgi:hypothetical protein